MFQADSEKLEQIAQLFYAQADAVRDMIQLLSAKADVLRGGAWIGLGADTFFDLLDSQVFPNLQKGIDGLETSGDQAKKIAQHIDEGIEYILSKTRVGTG
jgi:WXG100 family type VII secretion target